MDTLHGEKLTCLREPRNAHAIYAVALIKDGEFVGHIPRELSRCCSYILLAGGSIVVTVVGPKENNLGNGLEVPIKYQVKGPGEKIKKAEALINAKIKTSFVKHTL